MGIIEKKICIKCNQLKPLGEFYFKKDCKKYRNSCKMCESERQKKYRQKSPEKYANNVKKLQQTNKYKYSETARAYRDIHREHLNQKACATRKKRYEDDVNFKIKNTVSSRLRKILQKSGIEKNNRTVKYLGCTIDQFKNHIESLFLDGMGWDNHSVGGWHFDHILPCAAFDLENSEEQEVCFHYTNYQPLWAKDNISKGATI